MTYSGLILAKIITVGVLSTPFPALPAQATQTAAVQGVPTSANSLGGSGGIVEALLPGAKLMGSGELTWFGLKVYEAQLWSTSASAQALKVQPSKFAEHSFALDLRYARNLAGEAIAERSLAEIQKLGLGSSAQHDAWLSDMKKLFPNIKKGDRLMGVHVPSQGVQFFLNDRLLGRVEDLAFARAFFAIWFDARTKNKTLYTQLQGKTS